MSSSWAPAKNLTMGLCIDDKLQKFKLRGIERPAADGEADALIEGGRT